MDYETQILIYSTGFTICMGIAAAAFILAVIFFIRFRIGACVALMIAGRKRKRAAKSVNKKRTVQKLPAGQEDKDMTVILRKTATRFFAIIISMAAILALGPIWQPVGADEKTQVFAKTESNAFSAGRNTASGNDLLFMKKKKSALQETQIRIVGEGASYPESEGIPVYYSAGNNDFTITISNNEKTAEISRILFWVTGAAGAVETDYTSMSGAGEIVPAAAKNGLLTCSLPLKIKDDAECEDVSLYVKAVGTDGKSVTACHRFMVDTKAPVITGPAVTPSEFCTSDREYYNEELTFAFTVSDYNLEEAVLTYTWIDLNNESGEEDSQTITVRDIHTPGSASYDRPLSFTIRDGQMLTGFTVTATDRAGMITKDEQHMTVCKKAGLQKVVDTTPPAVTVTQSSRSGPGTVHKDAAFAEQGTDTKEMKYYKGPVVFTVSIYDRNPDLRNTSFSCRLNGKEKRLSFDQKGKTGTDRYVLTASVTLDDTSSDPGLAGDILSTLSGTVADKAGNTAAAVANETDMCFDVTNGTIETKKSAPAVCVDGTAPFVKIQPPSFSKSANSSGSLYYYNTPQTWTVEIKDIDLDPDASAVSCKIMENGKAEEVSISCSSPSAKKLSDGSYKLEIPVKNGQMISDFIVLAEDFAGNTNKETSYEQVGIIVDSTAPEVCISLDGAGVDSFFAAGEAIHVRFKDAAAGTDRTDAAGSDQTVRLTVTVTDENICAGGRFTNPFFVTNDLSNGIEWKGAVKKNTSSVLTYTQEMTVTPDTSGELTFRLMIRDLAGNPAADFESNERISGLKEKITLKNGSLAATVIADRNRPESSGDDHDRPVIELTADTENADVLEDGILLYSGNCSYSLSVYDPVCRDSEGRNHYAGLESVTWTVESDKEGLITTSGNRHSFSGERSASFTVPVIINGTGESDHIVIKITAADRAGNTITHEQTLAVDNERPRVTITYDNQDVRNGRYFNQPRTAQIRVEDLNFNPAKTTVSSQGEISGWTRDGNAYLASVHFTGDGDYTLEMATTDLAGNTAETDYSNAGKNTAPQAFTIDRTPPEITLAFDDTKSPLNNGYYNKARTAAVTILEHNFNAAQAVAEVRETYWEDGDQAVSRKDEDQTVPVENGIRAAGEKRETALQTGTWTSAGDIHRTTIRFEEDAAYTGKVSCTDLAGNPAKTILIDPFTIDTIPPEAVIENVEDAHAYSGSVTPSIRFHDLNFNREGYSVIWTVTGMDGTADISAQNPSVKSMTEHGVSLSFDSPEEIPENDGLYRLSATITDLAGNTSETAEVRYCLNRFGSVYDIEGDYGNFPETRSLLLQDHYTREAPVLSIRETSPDTLKSHQVSLAVGGVERVLQEGIDYDVVQDREGDLSWNRYVYTIRNSAFLDEADNLIQGEYHITLYSEDSAGNLNSNRTGENGKNRDITFTIDAEPPTGSISVEGLTQNSGTITASRTGIHFSWEDNTGVARADLYLNGRLERSLSGEELTRSGGTAFLEAVESSKTQTVSAVLTDEAGNSTRLDEVNFYLNSAGPRSFLRASAGLIAFISIAAVLCFIIAVLVFKKRKTRPVSADAGRSGIR